MDSSELTCVIVTYLFENAIGLMKTLQRGGYIPPWEDLENLVTRRSRVKMWDVEYATAEGLKVGRTSADTVVTLCKSLGWKARWHFFYGANVGELENMQNALKGDFDGGWVQGFVWAADQETGLQVYTNEQGM